ncbi:MAG TPA: ABC transporter transmembrane domain-containing protein, partial [Actinomycetes bacterium]
MSTRRTLPVATSTQVRAQARTLLAEHRRLLARMLVLNALAAAAALVGPRLLGDIVESVRQGTTEAHLDRLALLLALALAAQTVLTWWARRTGFVLGETVFAQLRERYLARVLSLPLSTVERAGTGDLVTRSTGDVEA